MSIEERIRHLKETYAGFSEEQKQAYGQTVVERFPLLVFELAVGKLQRGEIANYQVEPSKQQYARSGNTLVTLVDRSGQLFYIEVQYDPVSRQIYPPLV